MDREGALFPRALETTRSPGPTLELSPKEALEQEIVRRLNLQTAMRECAAKYEQAVRVQSELDEDLVHKETELEAAKRELKQKRQTIHNLESEIAQVTADHINGQSRWLNSVAQLNDEIGSLRQRLKDQEKEKEMLKLSTSPVKHTQSPPKRDPVTENVRVAYDKLEKHQNELMITELMARHEQTQKEIIELRHVNARLQQENEAIQSCIIERTIHDDLGGINLDDDIPVQDESLQNLTSDGKDLSYTKHNSELQFEVQSLENHNRALKLSLERLVHRFLESSQVPQSAQRATSPQSLERFNLRVSSHGEKNLFRPENFPTGEVSSFNPSFHSPSSHRVLSLGVDNEVRSIPIPRQCSPTGYRSSSGETRASSPFEDDSFIEIPKRTESQTGLRKLKMIP